MANHIKAGMLIEKKVYVVHIKTSISTIKKTGMLYILKLVCLLRNTEKNGYVVHIKTSMFTTEIQKKRCVAHIKTTMFTTEIRKKQVCCTY